MGVAFQPLELHDLIHKIVRGAFVVRVVPQGMICWMGGYGEHKGERTKGARCLTNFWRLRVIFQ